MTVNSGGSGRQNDEVFDFGIVGYRPRWLRGIEAVARPHDPRLAGLVGRTLRHVWLVWDLGADEWFADCPVLLDFGDEQVEINHTRTDDLSITFNSIDPHQPLTWPTSDGFQLAWRPEPIAQLEELRGQELRHASLLEWAGGTMADGSVALGFDFLAGHLTIYNALDENGFLFGEPGRNWREHVL
ncbi:hypothetical protein [Salinispora mooreana]|nr:hypothetical protein [Salinispora mooreana]